MRYSLFAVMYHVPVVEEYNLIICHFYLTGIIHPTMEQAPKTVRGMLHKNGCGYITWGDGVGFIFIHVSIWALGRFKKCQIQTALTLSHNRV